MVGNYDEYRGVDEWMFGWGSLGAEIRWTILDKINERRGSMQFYVGEITVVVNQSSSKGHWHTSNCDLLYCCLFLLVDPPINWIDTLDSLEK